MGPCSHFIQVAPLSSEFPKNKAGRVCKAWDALYGAAPTVRADFLEPHEAGISP